MKTAKEIHLLVSEPITVRHYENLRCSGYRAYKESDIEQIQLASAKWGMEQAAKQIRAEVETCPSFGDPNMCETCRGKINSAIDIITFAKNLTINQLPK